MVLRTRHIHDAVNSQVGNNNSEYMLQNNNQNSDKTKLNI